MADLFLSSFMVSLPIDSILSELQSVLRLHANVVLSAEPGAGKTTRVPVALMDEPWLQGKKVIMLEPRRLAAIRSAEYMAEQRNELVGTAIGYRIRGENKISAKTKLEVVTEGILTRMIQDDASLENIGLIIFDEFHERSIHADLGLALSLDIQQHLRNDLKILVMSATLDAAAVSELMGNAPSLTCHGRNYPVGVTYLAQPNRRKIEPVIANTVVKALREHEGDILVFLPGQHEIRTTESLLRQKELPPNVFIHLLYGQTSSAQQRSALQPAKNNQRKIILSTNIAETSLTIDGVRIVIDSGLMRTSTFDARRGMSGLVTVPVSKASAEQRKGRAGRQNSGHCYRLWTEAEQQMLTPFSKPEIVVTDLAPLAMELALWGDGKGSTLRFLDPPPAAYLTQARTLLHYLGALDDSGNLTAHGTVMGKLSIHPRYAHMLLKGKEMECGETACEIAALLDERDVLRGTMGADIDLSSRYSAFCLNKIDDRFAFQRIKEQSDRLKKMVGLTANHQNPKENKKKLSGDRHIGILLALAYPERIAKRKYEQKYQLSGNTVASLPKGSMLSREEYLAVGDVDGAGSDVRIFLAEAVTEQELRSTFADQIVMRESVVWDEKSEAISARTVTMLGAVELSEKAFHSTADRTIPLVIEAIRRYGLTVLPWTKETESIITRSEWLRKNSLVHDWTDLSKESLFGHLELWLAPFLDGVVRKNHFAKLDMNGIIRSMFTYQQQHELERLAPTHITVPTGSNIPLDYLNDPPILAVRLQEMFGEINTPTVGGGRIKVLLHLLSPARRPLAVTQDLPSFWKNAYVQVRKDMRGEYPKHYWPDDPLLAEPTRKIKRTMGGKVQ
ncbi:MAG: ATP-dependent helicase HrpB [Bacteroidetes bacterium]|nr:ATP-dependent helicase HrpB [Bacteroidota bacterium]